MPRSRSPRGSRGSGDGGRYRGHGRSDSRYDEYDSDRRRSRSPRARSRSFDDILLQATCTDNLLHPKTHVILSSHMSRSRSPREWSSRSSEKQRRRQERKRAEEERARLRREKEAAKARETPEEKIARRLAKKVR